MKWNEMEQKKKFHFIFKLVATYNKVSLLCELFLLWKLVRAEHNNWTNVSSYLKSRLE